MKRDRIEARNVVLGAGAVGSAAAYHLARRGEPVVIVEQFAPGHDRGSSHGLARITRHSYADARYARLMPAAFRAWRELEADAGRPLYIRTGGVSTCTPGVDYVERVAGCLAELDVPHRRLTGAELRRALPVFAVPDDLDAVYEPDAGLIAAEKAVATQLELARQLGPRTDLIGGCPVRKIDLDAERSTLLTDQLEIVAERLIVAAGAWVGGLLPPLAGRLKPERQEVLYIRPADPLPFAIGALPVFIHMGSGPNEKYYGMPDFLAGGVKVARHGGADCDPDRVERGPTPGYADEIHGYLRGYLPALADAPISRTEVCLYTVAPDEDFVVGPWPGRPDLIVASPCSGHGFKFSCLVGRSLAELAIDGKTEIGQGAWRPIERDAIRPVVS